MIPNILRAKCVVVGDPSVGKSAIIHAFLHDSDKFQKNYIMTIICGLCKCDACALCAVEHVPGNIKILWGQPVYHRLPQSKTCAIENKTKIISVPETEDAVELYLFDSAGKDIYLDFQVQMWHHPSLVCVVFDLTDENSFNSCSKWLDIVRNTGRYLTVPGVLIGSKSDLKERRAVKASVAQEYARKNNLQYFECSAKENKGVEEPFFYLVSEWHKMYLEKTEYFKSIS